jgi:hypothetical protein
MAYKGIATEISADADPRQYPRRLAHGSSMMESTILFESLTVRKGDKRRVSAWRSIPRTSAIHNIETLAQRRNHVACVPRSHRPHQAQRIGESLEKANDRIHGQSGYRMLCVLGLTFRSAMSNELGSQKIRVV